MTKPYEPFRSNYIIVKYFFPGNEGVTNGKSKENPCHKKVKETNDLQEKCLSELTGLVNSIVTKTFSEMNKTKSNGYIYLV